ncbi:MAG: helix-turn-helix domain-containing protein [Planctomycetes bacterium]|nr:helix-turn-helix domain-containing protein [Planctomycetota bacterium]
MNKPLGLNEVCYYLGVSRWTLMRWIKKGILPAQKLGGRWVVEERILHKFSIERDSALFSAKSSRKPATVSDIISSYGRRQATYQDNKPLKLKEVMDVLGVCRRTITGWISQGKIAASKMGGQWVVWENDLNEFVKRRMLFLDDAAVKMRFFSSSVLEQYRKDTRYYVHEAAFHGRVGNKEEREKMHQKRSLTKRHPHLWSKEYFGKDDYKLMDSRSFAELLFWKVRHKDGGWMIAIDPRAFHLIPEPERRKWSVFEAHNPVY